MNSRRFFLLAVSLFLCLAILAPMSVYAGPTEPTPYDDHPWGGEEPPVDPDPSGIYVIEIGGPILVIDISALISYDREIPTLDKSETIQNDYNIDKETAKTNTTISTGIRMSTAKRY